MSSQKFREANERERGKDREREIKNALYSEATRYTHNYQHYSRQYAQREKRQQVERDVIAVSLLNNRTGQTVKKVIVSHTEYKECSNEFRITHKGRDVNNVVRMECEIKIIVKHNPFIESIIPISMWHN